MIGGLLGVIPQCGFSAAASSLYAGRVISLGTIFAVFFSTSDEMLPILISEDVPVKTIIKILGTKVVIAIVSGFIVELIYWMFIKRSMTIWIFMWSARKNIAIVVMECSRRHLSIQ